MTTVGLVLMPDAAVRLLSLRGRMHVWAVDSPAHRAAAERVWAGDPAHGTNRGITLFGWSPGGDLEGICRRVLVEIELHHGEYSQSPPYQAVEVLGCPLSDRLRSEFEEFGFSEFTSITEGFRAERPADACSGAVP